MSGRSAHLNGLQAPWRRWALLLFMVAWSGAAQAQPRIELSPCRLKGVEHEARCGFLRRPLDPAQPQGVQIDIHVAVLPAVARNPLPDPVVFLAGGPGQSAIDLAGPIASLMGRFLNRRDLLLVDQRGTGRSAPLRCEDDAPVRSLAEMTDPARQAELVRACRQRLQALPYGDLRQFTTLIAAQDLEAVRRALGYGPVNLFGVSYGTRAALETLRQFPGSVRRAVLDGVAPPDMALPLAMSADAQTALDALFADCEREPGCARRYPGLRLQWRGLLASLPRQVQATHPVTGREEKVLLTRDMLTGLVRAPLYVPALASGLPLAISEASQGRYGALLGLGTGGAGGRGLDLAMGMHFSVICAEDMPRLETSAEQQGADFGESALKLYRQVCAGWPRTPVPAAFYTLPVAQTPVLLLSGAIDPATPPRHAERVRAALGPLALHVVVPQTGHGVLANVSCLREAAVRFVNQERPADALAGARADANCAALLPRPLAFQPVGDGNSGSADTQASVPAAAAPGTALRSR